MKVGIYLRVDAPSQKAIADAVVNGALKCGERAWIFDEPELQTDADAIVLFGIGGDAKRVYDASAAAGQRTVLLDKPYVRAAKSEKIRRIADRYHILRVAVDGFQPLRYFQLEKHRADRWTALGITPAPYERRQVEAILFDGASSKYIAWNELGNGVGTALEQWAEWGQRMVNTIACSTRRPILYRPRPSHNPPPGTIQNAELSERPLAEDLARAAIVVSYGGNIGFDAVLAGIPHFAIGDSIARPVSETVWSRLDIPWIPDPERRQQWLHDLAYCQWDLSEFRDGTAWRYIRQTMEQLDGLR